MHPTVFTISRTACRAATPVTRVTLKVLCGEAGAQYFSEVSNHKYGTERDCSFDLLEMDYSRSFDACSADEDRRVEASAPLTFIVQTIVKEKVSTSPPRQRFLVGGPS